MSLEQQFKSVAESVRTWKKKPEDSVNLEVYSWFKQATFGDVNIPEPSGIVEKAKWKAWSSHKGVSKEEAQKKYIELAEKYAPKYA